MIPNVHFLGALIIAYTVVYRKKALYPIYAFVVLIGMFNGFSTWWIPYLYIWTVLWGMTMLLPKNIPEKIKPFVYMILCSLHGLLYGVLYAPVQAIMFGMDMQKTLAWIMTGLPWDVTHAIGNFFAGLLVLPIVRVLRIAEQGKIMG